MSDDTSLSRPAAGAVSWNINTSCNYRCSYCTQRMVENRSRWAEDVPRFLDAFGRLAGEWEVKISGGEPFVHPRFLELVAGLARLGHRVSVSTNFSARPADLAAFLDAAGSRLRVFSASLHPEYVADRPDEDGPGTLADFIARICMVQQRLRAGASTCVTCVATREALPRLPAWRERFAAAGITFKVQPQKEDRRVLDYTEEERRLILALGGHNLTGEIAPCFHGHLCWAGARYFIVDDRGNAYRCYPARRLRQESLGSFLSPSFRLFERSRPCPYDYCNCTVPIERGMMSRQEKSP